MAMTIERLAELCLAHKFTEVVKAVTADPDMLRLRTQFGDSVLDLAITTGNVEAVSGLLLAGTCPTPARPKEIPLITAIRSGAPNGLEIVRLLIQHGADVNAPGVLIASAMHAAVAESSIEMAGFLLASGADIDVRYPPDNFTPLWFACLTDGNEGMVQFLLAYAPDHGMRNTTCSTSPLDEAIRTGNVTNVSALLEAGANPNCRGLGRETPLTNAILSGTPNAQQIVSLLLQHGADVNATGEHIASAFHAAVLAAPIELVELSLRSGANVNGEIAIGRSDAHANRCQ